MKHLYIRVRSVLMLMTGLLLLMAGPAWAISYPPIWDFDYGVKIRPYCDDCWSGFKPLGMTFPYLGQNYTSIDVSTNGFISLGGSNGEGCLDEFLNLWRSVQLVYHMKEHIELIQL